jgi:Mn2+/Fe2+ NRAMP family transporter
LDKRDAKADQETERIVNSAQKKLIRLLRKPISRLKCFLESLGPGLITGASDDDPSGIATYSQAGAQFGLGLLWMALFQYPMMVVIQETCARICLVTGSGLNTVTHRFISKKLLTL